MTASTTATAPAPPQRPLVPSPVAILWFAAILSWASGRLGGQFGLLNVASPDDPRLPLFGLLGTLPTTIAVLLAGIGLAVLWMRREPDPITRVPAIAASAIAVAGALSAVAVLALVAAGPDRPIGFIDVPVGTTVALTTAAAGASTAILIRPYVDAMAAHVWAGIGGAGLALPFMVAGVSPAFVMAAVCGLAVADRVHGLRVERDLAFRRSLEAERIAEQGDRGRGIGVSGLPGPPPAPRAPRPQLPWSSDQRRASVSLGIVAVVIVAAAWTVGSTLGTLGFVVVLGAVAPGFAVATLGAIALLWQAAVLLRVTASVRYGLTVLSGMLAASSIAIATAPVAGVYLAAVGLQSLAVGWAVALLVRHARSGGTVVGQVMLGIAVALGWLLVVVPTGALPLAFLAVLTTLLALRRKVRA